MGNLSRLRRLRRGEFSPWERPARRRHRRIGRLAAATTALAVGGGLVGTGLLGGAGLAGATPAAALHPAAASRPAGSLHPAAAPVFVPIRETFDGNRVARPLPAAATCKKATTTLQLVACNNARTENVDVQINAVRAKQFAAATTDAARRAINADGAAWLANRLTVCEVSYPAEGGGTIGEVIVSGCLTNVSRARLALLQGRPVPIAHLVATDDTDPHATQYTTTGTGSLIGAIDTQGDQTGGVVIAWVVIGGYKGFTVKTGSFTYVDGAFVDKGIVAGHPGGHHVAAGHQYVFDIDYSTLPKDPNATKGTGRFEFRSAGHLVGTWK
jgi:uncharacterized protein YecT (DUF1311 family)